MTYIFDFDGTLVDSMQVFSAVMEEIFRENNLPIPDDFVKIITPLGYTGTAKYAISLGLKLTVEEFCARATEKMAPQYHNTIPAKAFVKEKLLQLKEKGHSLNVLTASPHAVLDKCLERVGLYNLFDNVWSCDDFATTKADPQIYVRAAAKLGRRVEECMFVDDNVGAVSTARQAGMVAVGIYDDSSKDLVKELTAAADIYIYDFREL
ncbi:MAG: HAD family phosphatase [Oscillospiraceae bacterium]|nr:HAD family phosphatase [Oscillospiraceae bacterium]